MRVLAVHNFYSSQQPSGENVAFDAECTLLRRKGVEVHVHIRASDELRSKGGLGTIIGAAATPWNPFEARRLRAAVDKLQPDVVHVHNTFPLISPSIFHAIRRRAARVLTLHNYRLFCAAAIPMRNGRVCTECIDRRAVTPALVHGCYRNSRLATVPVAMNVALHRKLGTWNDHVDAYIALSDFQRHTLIVAGLPAERIHVKSNFTDVDSPPPSWQQRTDTIVFVGRLTPEKGVRTLIEAWRAWGAAAPELLIIGDGPDSPSLKALAQGNRIQFLGHQTKALVRRYVSRAKLLVVPSEAIETFGIVVIEAFSSGTPVAAAEIGALPSLVRTGHTGALFRPFDSTSLLNTVRGLWAQPKLLENMGEQARRTCEQDFAPETNYTALLKIYEKARNERRRSRA